MARSTIDYAAAADAAFAAKDSIDQYARLCSKFTETLNKARQVGVISNRIQSKLMLIARRFPRCLETSRQAEKLVAKHCRAIAIASAELGATGEILQTALRLCIEVCERLSQFDQNGPPEDISSWEFVEILMQLHHSDEPGLNGLPSPRFTFSMVEAVAIRSEMISSRVVEEISSSPTPLLLEDGPHIGRYWVHNGKPVGEVMKPNAWKMVNYLWGLQTKSCQFKDLAGPVYDDKNAIVSKAAVGSFRRVANAFFRDQCVPWHVEISDPVVKLGQGAPQIIQKPVKRPHSPT